MPPVLLEGNHQKIDAWRGQQSRERTRLRRPELYEQWCETHPLTEIPKWKRGENVRLVRTAEQMELPQSCLRRATGALVLGAGCRKRWMP